MNRRDLILGALVAPLLPTIEPSLSEASILTLIERYGQELEGIRPTRLLVRIPCKPMNHYVLVGLPKARHPSGIILDKGSTATASPGEMVEFHPWNAMWIECGGLHYAVIPDYCLSLGVGG